MLIKTINNELLASFIGNDVRFRSFSDDETVVTLVCCMGLPMTVRVFASFVGQRLTNTVNLSNSPEIDDLWKMEGLEIPKDAKMRFSAETETDDLSPFSSLSASSMGWRMDACQNAVAGLLDRLAEEEGGLTGLKRAMRDLDDAYELSIIDVSKIEMTLFPESVYRLWL